MLVIHPPVLLSKHMSDSPVQRKELYTLGKVQVGKVGKVPKVGKVGYKSRDVVFLSVAGIRRLAR